MIEKPECIKVEQLASDFREGKHQELDYYRKSEIDKYIDALRCQMMGDGEELMDFEYKDSIEIEYTPKHCGRKSCFNIPKSIMGSEAVPLFLPIQSYIYNDVNGGTVIVTDVSSNPYSSFEVVIQYVHKNLGKRVCTSRITDAQTISSEEGFNIVLKKLLHLAQKHMSEGERDNG